MVKIIDIAKKFAIGTNDLTFIGGPCVIESEELILTVAERLKEICERVGINYVFKASFDKANRSSISSFRGPGIKKGLEILKKVKEQYNLPIITDIHESWQAEIVAEVVDIIQIPAFLCRQTDLLVSAAKTGKPLSIKKGQFMAPGDMINVIKKLNECNFYDFMLCERGTSFGYNNLVVDMRGLVEMRDMGYPVIFDVTHSVQKPGGNGDTTGGDRKYVLPLMKAGIAVGIDAIFAEVHPDPDNALSDGPNMLKLDNVEHILKDAIALNNLIKSR